MQSKPVKLDSSVLRGRTRGYIRRPLAAVPARQLPAAKQSSYKPATMSEIQPLIKKSEPASLVPVHNIKHQPVRVAQQTSNRLQVSSRQGQTKPQTRHRRVLKHVPTLPIPSPKGFGVLLEKIKALFTNIPRPNKPFIIGIILTIVCLCIGLYVIQNKRIDDSFAIYRKAGVATSDLAAAKAAEVQPTIGAIQNYKVSPDEPRVLTMPQLGIMAPIKPLESSITTPAISPQNIYDIGWYSASAKPGDSGVVIVTGNVSGVTKDGVFHNLSNLIAGSIVTIERGDGEIIRYKVMSSEYIDTTKNELDKITKSYDKSRQGLNLVTAPSTIGSQSQTGNKQLVVYAVRDN